MPQFDLLTRAPSDESRVPLDYLGTVEGLDDELVAGRARIDPP